MMKKVTQFLAILAPIAGVILVFATNTSGGSSVCNEVIGKDSSFPLAKFSFTGCL